MVLGTMTFGYSTREFEVTADRLGTYRPEEHIDNPKGYADGEDARKYDVRLRPAVRDIELQIDTRTGMKNYIANEDGDWATSSKYAKFSLERSIWFGRKWVKEGGKKGGKEEDLCEALRCLGQGLHTLEDFSAHSNYIELALREMGYLNVFPYTGISSAIMLQGKKVFPLVTGSFGGVDFFHSVIGEVNDHVAQTQTEEIGAYTCELEDLDNALGHAQETTNSHPVLGALTSLLNKIPGGQSRELIDEAKHLQRSAGAQARQNYEDERMGADSWNGTPTESDYYAHAPGGSAYGASMHSRDGPADYDAAPEPHHSASEPTMYGTHLAGKTSNNTAGPEAVKPDSNFDPQKTIEKIKPILAFRDKVNRKINGIVDKIPGLEALKEKIGQQVQILVFSFLAPFIKPVIKLATKGLKEGSTELLKKSEEQQFEPWRDPYCTDPTHSLLSKDHFSNVLNEPAGHVAAEILKFVVPKVFLAWERPDMDVQALTEECLHILHHPALRDKNSEAHKAMFSVVESWAKSTKSGWINDILSADSVRAGKNHIIRGSNNSGGGTGSGQKPPNHGHAQEATAAAGSAGGLSGLLGQFTGSQGHKYQGHLPHGNQSSSSGGGEGGDSGNFLSSLAHLASSHGHQGGESVGHGQSHSSGATGLLGALGGLVAGASGQSQGHVGGNGGGSGGNNGSGSLLSTLGHLAGSSHNHQQHQGGGEGGQSQLLGKLASMALNHQGGGGSGGGGHGTGGVMQNLQTLHQLSGLVGKRELPGEESINKEAPGPAAYYAAHNHKYDVVSGDSNGWGSQSQHCHSEESASYYQQQQTYGAYEAQAQDSRHGNSDHTKYDYSAYGVKHHSAHGTGLDNSSYDYSSYDAK
ncbi:hypothetical protein KEM54_004815 [Ascosphaera aggregata]|nr:hypothetical protein KEM54_004815 [Ascosphaera aggregata]